MYREVINFIQKTLYPKYCFQGNTGLTETIMEGLLSMSERDGLGLGEEAGCSGKGIWVLRDLREVP